jgi:hypothetical protein
MLGLSMSKSVVKARAVVSMHLKTRSAPIMDGTSFKGTWIVTRDTLIFLLAIIIT